MELTRRKMLMGALFGGGLLGLRALASGIPAWVLANPRAALDQHRRRPANANAMRPAQYVILTTSSEGDPLNANAPGSYVNPDVGHPAQPSMAPTSLLLAGNRVVAAKPWSTLPQQWLDRTCFFHHGTYTVIHSDEESVMSLGGATPHNEMFASMLAAQLAPRLGTVQRDPIVLRPLSSTEDLNFEGRSEPILTASVLADMLRPSGPLGKLTRLRDADLNRLNNLAKSECMPGASEFIDQYARTQEQVRSLSESLLSTLGSIHGDGPESQVKAAVTLIRMNVAPVISIHIPFGGDNHTDIALQGETRDTLSGVAILGQLWSQLIEFGYQDKVSLLSLNVFGRTLRASTSVDGRQHNGNHHVAVMSGAPFAGGVIGGIETVDHDLGAMSISSATGEGVPEGHGDIPFAKTMQSMAATFGKGVGADPEFLAKNISSSTVVDAALA